MKKKLVIIFLLSTFLGSVGLFVYIASRFGYSLGADGYLLGAKLIFYCLVLGLFGFISSLFIKELKKINAKTWKPIIFIVGVLGIAMIYKYESRTFFDDESFVNFIHLPMLWFLGFVSLGYLVSFLYRKYKLSK